MWLIRRVYREGRRVSALVLRQRLRWWERGERVDVNILAPAYFLLKLWLFVLFAVPYRLEVEIRFDRIWYISEVILAPRTVIFLLKTDINKPRQPLDKFFKPCACAVRVLLRHTTDWQRQIKASDSFKTNGLKQLNSYPKTHLTTMTPEEIQAILDLQRKHMDEAFDRTERK